MIELLPEEMSLAERLKLLPDSKREQFLKEFKKSDLANLEYCWPFWRRPKQHLPLKDKKYNTFMILAGRGFGKTRVAAESVREVVEDGSAKRIALCGPTAADVRDVIIEGPSGLMNVFPPSKRPKWEPSKRKITFYNGAVGFSYSADQPDRFRGPQHDFAICDELSSWQHVDAWDQLQFGLRLGAHPRCVITTTPKSTTLIRNLVRDSKSENSSTFLVFGSTYENRSNLAPSFFSKIISKYEGTRLGRQEIYAAILEDVEGALWNASLLDDTRVNKLPPMKRIVVAIDPAATSKDGSDETGIIVGGLGADNQGYTLADISGRYTPHQWATKAVKAFKDWKADRMIAETNNGGEMVWEAIRTVDSTIPFKALTASRGKRTRAEPISALYEQKRIHHYGVFADLEQQMCEWDPIRSTSSPDRMDALVWAMTELMMNNRVRRDFSAFPIV